MDSVDLKLEKIYLVSGGMEQELSLTPIDESSEGKSLDRIFLVHAGAEVGMAVAQKRTLPMTSERRASR
ncbi:MAG: hypothetical protein JNK17_03410 [Hydrogenophaga sp.]|nr:hypothetical protein [Hydrogenophaga sp.]